MIEQLTLILASFVAFAGFISWLMKTIKEVVRLVLEKEKTDIINSSQELLRDYYLGIDNNIDNLLEKYRKLEQQLAYEEKLNEIGKQQIEKRISDLENFMEKRLNYNGN